MDSAGLAWLVDECEQAVNVIGVCATPIVSGGLSATSAAVRGLHSDVAAVAQRIKHRLQSTAEAASSAASAFADAEARNEDLIYEV